MALAALVKRIQLFAERADDSLMFVALKKRLSPTERVRKRDLLTAYKKLQEPPRDMDLEDWLIR
jgi:hypothetical protein